MSRLMSVTLTEDAVVAREKDVTRRLGWLFLRRGHTLTLCRKVMGRKGPDGTVEPLVRLAEVVVVDVRREPLCAITDRDVVREGFGPERRPGWWTEHERPAEEFVAMFTKAMRCKGDSLVTRVEWRYL